MPTWRVLMPSAPTPSDYRHALRDVVGHCIYGVDKNPMAIALAKTALWLEAYTPDRPLTFIDHHLQVGDALLGVYRAEHAMLVQIVLALLPVLHAGYQMVRFVQQATHKRPVNPPSA
jgi:hypothetical protein